jgi:hypothetical protein
MKTGSADEFAVPDLLVPYLVTYLDIIRPRMLRRPSCRALWVSRKGGILLLGDLAHRRAPLAPTAGSASRASPRDLLTHAHIGTTQYYIRRDGIEASRAYAKRIGDIRKGR